MTASSDALRTAEHRLQAAQLASDVPALDDLLDDDVLYTGPDGALLGKADDLDAHRGGAQVLQRPDEVELRVRAVGSAGITWLLADVAVTSAGGPFAARVRYTRTWAHDGAALAYASPFFLGAPTAPTALNRLVTTVLGGRTAGLRPA